MADFKHMLVNEGDPITSELLGNIVTNINLLNNMVKTTSGDANTPSTQVIDSGRPSVECKMDNSGKATIKFNKTFAVRPNIVCTIWQTSGENFTTQKYLPIVTSASATEFTVRMQNIGATRNGNVYVQWIAVSPSETQASAVYKGGGGGGGTSLIQ